MPVSDTIYAFKEIIYENIFLHNFHPVGGSMDIRVYLHQSECGISDSLQSSSRESIIQAVYLLYQRL